MKRKRPFLSPRRFFRPARDERAHHRSQRLPITFFEINLEDLPIYGSIFIMQSRGAFPWEAGAGTIMREWPHVSHRVGKGD